MKTKMVLSGSVPIILGKLPTVPVGWIPFFDGTESVVGYKPLCFLSDEFRWAVVPIGVVCFMDCYHNAFSTKERVMIPYGSVIECLRMESKLTTAKAKISTPNIDAEILEDFRSAV